MCGTCGTFGTCGTCGTQIASNILLIICLSVKKFFPKYLKSVLINTPIGSISEPIILPEGILLFTVREKRKIEKFDSLEDAKNQLVNAEKTKILNMFSLTHYDAVKRLVPVKYY